MCIVCDIKQAVEASGPNKEDRAKILGLVEKLAEALGDVLEVAQEVHEANPEAFQPEHVARLQNAADLLNDRGELPDVNANEDICAGNGLINGQLLSIIQKHWPEL